mmetsp:Transcript_4886/g.15486  ORF Transcript_4886/g.15486 Transcript_4886/m.15486 type:complete len:245 (+) Transcript_4886:908-1642(+)
MRAKQLAQHTGEAPGHCCRDCLGVAVKATLKSQILKARPPFSALWQLLFARSVCIHCHSRLKPGQCAHRSPPQMSPVEKARFCPRRSMPRPGASGSRQSPQAKAVTDRSALFDDFSQRKPLLVADKACKVDPGRLVVGKARGMVDKGVERSELLHEYPLEKVQQKDATVTGVVLFRHARREPIHDLCRNLADQGAAARLPLLLQKCPEHAQDLGSALSMHADRVQEHHEGFAARGIVRAVLRRL